MESGKTETGTTGAVDMPDYICDRVAELEEDESVKNYKFYTPDNIFVIGEDDYSHLKEFVLSPYKEVDGFDTNIFDVHQWLDRMRNNKEFHE